MCSQWELAVATYRLGLECSGCLAWWQSGKRTEDNINLNSGVHVTLATEMYEAEQYQLSEMIRFTQFNSPNPFAFHFKYLSVFCSF